MSDFNITYKYVDTNNTSCKPDTIASLKENTTIEFSTKTAPVIPGYTPVAVSQDSLTVTADTTITYTYFKIPNDAALVTINENNRTMSSDGTLLLGVEYDHDAQKVYFKIPIHIGGSDLIDLENDEVEIHVNFINASGSTYQYKVTETVLHGEFIFCTWLLSEQVTSKKGSVTFNVCINKISEAEEIQNSIKTYESIKTLAAGGNEGHKITYNNDTPAGVNERIISKCVVTTYVKKQNSSEYVIDTDYSSEVMFEPDGDTGKYFTCTVGNDGTYTLSDKELAVLNASKSFIFYDKNTVVNVTSTPDAVADRYSKSVFTFTFRDTVPLVVSENEWHTVPYAGQVLPGIKIDASTPIVTNRPDVTSIYLLSTMIDNLTRTVAAISSSMCTKSEVADMIGGAPISNEISVATIGVRDESHSLDSSYGYEEFEMERGFVYIFQDNNENIYTLTSLSETLDDLHSTPAIVNTNEEPIEVIRFRYLVYNQSLKRLHMVDTDVYDANDPEIDYNPVVYNELKYIKLPFKAIISE